MAAALVLATLAAVGAFRAYRVADRKVRTREQQLRDMAVHVRELADTVTEQAAELTLTREACDRQTVKARHMFHQAQGYRAEVARLSARVAELRGLADESAGAVRPPSAIEEMTAWLGTLPTAEEQEYRRD